MIRWSFRALFAILVVANAWMALGLQPASAWTFDKVCGCVYGGGPGGPSGPGVPACFDLQAIDCNSEEDCPPCPVIE